MSNDLSNQRLPLRVKAWSGARSSFLILSLVPLMILTPVLWHANGWEWVVSAAALIGLILTYWYFRGRYFLTPEAIEFKHGWKHQQMKWSDIDAIGERVVHGKYTVLGIFVRVYAGDRCLEPMLRREDAEAFVKALARHCPKALWMDEDRGTFMVRGSSNSEKMREVVARQQKRLRRTHAWKVAAASLLFAPLLLVLATRGWPFQQEAGSIGVCLLTYSALTWEHWAALRRLR